MKKKVKSLGPDVNDETLYGLPLTLNRRIADNFMRREAQIGTVTGSEVNDTDSENYIAHNFSDPDRNTEPFEELDDMPFHFF